MDGFATEEGDGDERNVDGGCNTSAGADFDFTLDAWLGSVNQWLGPGGAELPCRMAVLKGAHHSRGDSRVSEQKIAICRA